MVTLNHNTKKAQNFLQAYFNSTASELRQLYKHYSSYKSFGYQCCRLLYLQENGRRFRIFSANNFTFTAGWTRRDGDIRIETRNTSYLIKFTNYEKIHHA